jgi:hypothetical protein
MGILDDAIREHLELKRRLGASEEELKREEDQAFGRARAATFATSGIAEADDRASVVDVATSLEPTTEPIEPDEVLPEEALELEPSALGERSLAESAEGSEAEGDWGPGAEPEEEPDEDVLEETPEFLEETPEQDRLWFEQKPPKDFDFDD